MLDDLTVWTQRTRHDLNMNPTITEIYAPKEVVNTVD